MAVKDKTPEEKIDEAIAAGRIVMADTDEVDCYEDIAVDFLKQIFNIDYDECFISDESALSDFSACAMDDEQSQMFGEGHTLKELYAYTDKIMIAKINAIYGVDVRATDLLVDVFDRIHLNSIKHLN
jgi:hypothetical protein